MVVAKLLINNGAEVNAKDDSGYMPLHLAAQWNLHDRKTRRKTRRRSQKLLDNGAEVNATRERGDTPLDIARERNAVEVEKVLIANGATN